LVASTEFRPKGCLRVGGDQGVAHNMGLGPDMIQSWRKLMMQHLVVVL
jgi:hypothetical protein